jgi:hypothetical protein
MAQARKTRERKFPQAEFEVVLADAVAVLLPVDQVEPNDQWHFHVDGVTLKITRIRAPEETPVDPSAPEVPNLVPAKRAR